MSVIPAALLFPEVGTTWAWVAGLFEGEGTICDDGKTKVVVRVTMSDLDVLQTLDRIAPSPGGLHVKTKQPGSHKRQWVWQLAAKSDVERFLKQVRPFMHGRRGERIERALLRLGNGRRVRNRR